jgi:hypothetical protein
MILKPDFMESLQELDAQFSDKIALSIQYDKVYLAIKTNKDTFDFDSKGEIPQNPTRELEWTKAFMSTLISLFDSTPGVMKERN